MTRIEARSFSGLLLIALLFSGCGVGSIYGPQSYSETKLTSSGMNEDVRRVTFRGGDHPMTGDLCLLRCAEVTIASGNFFFQVVDSESGSSFDQVPSVYPFHRHYFMEDPFFHDVATVTKTIRILGSESEVGFCYDALEVSKSMRQKYNLNQSDGSK